MAAIAKEWITTAGQGKPPSRVIYLYVMTDPPMETSGLHGNLHTFKLATGVYCEYRKTDVVKISSGRFVSARECNDWVGKVSAKDRRTWIVAHDCGKAIVCLDILSMVNTGYRLHWFVARDPPTIFEVQATNGPTLLYCDIRNYINADAEVLGKTIGIPVGREVPADSSDEELFRYAEHLTLITRKAFEHVREYHITHRIGPWAYTMSGLSLSSWRSTHGSMPICKSRPENVKRLERACYYSPPIEAYHYGKYKGRCYLVDVVSMFPAIMRDNPVPHELYAHGRGLAEYRKRFGRIGRNVAATVLVESSERSYPIRLRDGVYFATGKYWTNLCGPELYNAFQRGDIADLSRWALYEMKVEFRDYVDYWYPLKSICRARGDKLGEYLAKQMTITLHGKLGQRKQVWKEVERLDTDPEWGEWKEYNTVIGRVGLHRAIAGKVELQVGEVESRNSFTAMPAWIAAYVREYMREAVDAAGYQNVLYIVADGAIVTETGYYNLLDAGRIHSGELGQLEVKSYAESCTIKALGNYLIGETERHAGFAAPNIPRDDGIIHETVRQRLGDVMRTGPALGILEYGRTRRLHVGNRRRLRGAEGWTAAPHIVYCTDSARKAAEGEIQPIRYDGR